MPKFNIKSLQLLKNPEQNLGLKHRKRSSKPNGRPEKQVEKEVMAWLNQNGFYCHVVESKAVYSQAAGQYLKGQTVPGMSDIIGVTPLNGLACFIELKAKGRRSVLSSAQKHFLKSNIEMDAFAVCVDSAALLETYYAEFKAILWDKPKSRQYLLSLID